MQLDTCWERNDHLKQHARHAALHACAQSKAEGSEDAGAAAIVLACWCCELPIGLALLHFFSLARNEIWVKQEAVWAGQGTRKQRGPKGQRGDAVQVQRWRGRSTHQDSGQGVHADGRWRWRCHAGQTGLCPCSTSGLVLVVAAPRRRPLLSSPSQKDR